MKLYNKIIFCIAVLNGLFISCENVIAAQKALLVGVGEYQIPNKELPGIDVDIQLMKEILARLGYAESEIKILHNKDATLQNIKKAITNWLVDGVQKNDRIVIYFGTHGSRIYDVDGDEEDQVDEVLLAHDAKFFTTKHGRTLKNVVIDDDLANWLANIPSENIFVLVDACNSGSVTRSVKLSNLSLGVETAAAKFFYYDGIPDESGSTFTRSLVNRSLDQNVNYIAISAAKDHEMALSTEQGSFFTLGIFDGINKASNGSGTITVEQLHRHADSYIAKTISREKRYHPQLHGNEYLAKKKYKLFKFMQGHGSKWQSLEKISNQVQDLELSLNQEEYALQDSVYIAVDLPKVGYLNIVSVNAYDQGTILFPNKFNLDNYVNSTNLTIPSKNMPFKLAAVKPTGPTLIVGFLSTAPINLYELSYEGRDIGGALNKAFATLSYSGIRAITLESEKTKQNYEDVLYSKSVYTNIKMK